MEIKVNNDLTQKVSNLVNGENDGNFKLLGNTKSLIINEHEIVKHWNQDTALASGNNNGNGSNIFLRPYGADDATNQAKLNPTGTLEVGGLVTERDQNIKRTDVDASKTNNNVSAITYPTSFNILDSGNRILARQEACITPTGPIESYWYIRNYNTSGDMVAQKGIKMSMAKDGSLTYNIADAVKFRQAIDVAQQGNYNFYKFTGSMRLDSTTSPISKELTITTHGRPVYIAVTGDNNPLSETCWFNIYFYRGTTALSHQIVESHASSHNIPFSMIYLDNVPAGTYTYKVEFSLGNGEASLNEDGNIQSPNFTIFEI